MSLMDNLCYFVSFVCLIPLVRHEENSHKYKNGQTIAQRSKQNLSKRINNENKNRT